MYTLLVGYSDLYDRGRAGISIELATLWNVGLDKV